MIFIGIDISKDKFDATLLADQDQTHFATFDNEKSGFRSFANWAKKKAKKQNVHIVMEATNIYWEELALYLHNKQLRLSVVNPAKIKGFAQSILARHKNDKLDSSIIARFGQERQPEPWVAPSPQQRQLRALVRHRTALKKTRSQQMNRLAMTLDDSVQESLTALITSINEQIEIVTHKIEQLIDGDDDLKGNQKLLESIKGIGSETSSLLLAEFYDLASYSSASAVAADAGITPSSYESGTSVRRKPRMSRVGKATVRGGLFNATRSAMRFNPLVQALNERLLAANKPYWVRFVACMRKLLHIAYGVIKNQTSFNADIMSTKIA